MLCTPALALDPDKAFNHYVRKAWSIQEGLPQISVQTIAQDQQGYIWVGTQAGLARFDGIRFTTYTPETTPALPGIFIRSLFADRTGRLLIGTYKGLSVYEKGEFRSVPIADSKKYPVLDIYAILENGADIVVATASGVFDLRQGQLVHREGSPLPAQALLKRQDGLWVASLGGVVRIEGTQSELLALPVEASKALVTHLVQAQGQVWAGTSLGLYVRSGDRWKIASDNLAFQHSPITMLYEDHDHNLWVGSNAGLARMRDGALVEFTPEKNPVAFKGVIAAFEDREYNLWLGSQWQGLARLWNGVTRRYGTAEGLAEPLVWSVSRAPDGRTWVGTNDGLSVFDHGHFTQVLRGDQLPHPHAYNVLAEADRIWIGTRHGLVVWRNGKVEAPALFAPMASAQINGIVRARDGSVWIPTSDGLFRLADDKLKRYGQEDGLRDVRVRQVRELKDGRLLVGSQDGLYEFDGKRFQQLGLESGLRPGMDISAIGEMHNGDLVIGTLSEELYMFDGRRWQKFGREQGFPNNAPFLITEDDHGFLWAAGIRGVERAALAEMRRLARGEVKSVATEMVLNERGDRRSGQQGFCCNGAGNSKGFMDDAGSLWLPTRDGVVTLDTHGIVKNTVAPTVVIERLQYLNQWHDVRVGQTLTLPKNARDLAFEFTALSFQDPASVELQYRLRGYDRDWRDLMVLSPRATNYTNLPAGAYTFEVRAMNNADVWNIVPTGLSFNIKPYFYETGWFYLLLVLVLAALVYGGSRLQRRAHMRQRALLESQVAERTQQLNEANLQLENASQTDPLTGLRNRRYLSNQIPFDLAFYDRERVRIGKSNHALLFALVDIDHFKRINDTYGHKAGDVVLQQFSERMTRLVRVGDYVVRWGGEEFLLVFRPVAQQFVAMLGERIRNSIAEQVFDLGDGVQVSITCSIGLSECALFRDEQHQVGWEQMIELADAALYWVKQNGRNGWAALRPTAKTDFTTVIGSLKNGAQTLIDGDRLSIISSKDEVLPTDLGPDAQAAAVAAD